MPTPQTVLMDRSCNRVSNLAPFVPSQTSLIPSLGSPVFYTGKTLSNKIGIASGRIGIVDSSPIPGSGSIVVSFGRLPMKPNLGEEAVEDAPEAFILDPRNLRPVPSSILAKKEEVRKNAAAKRQA